MSKFIKFKNCKLSLFSFPYVPGPKILGAFGRDSRQDMRVVEFKDNCSYNGSSKDGINILFGYRLGRNDMVCLGWRYLSISKNIEILGAYIINGVYSERFLMSAEHNKAYIMFLKVNWEEGSFHVTIETALNRGYKLHTTIKAGGMATDGVIFKKRCISHGLRPTIGNISTNPEGIMELRIERI